MLFRYIVYFLLVSLLIARSQPSSSDLAQNVPEPVEAPFEFSTEEFGTLRVEEVEKDPVGPEDGPEFPDDAPAHRCYHLDKERSMPALDKGPRFFNPAYSFICFVPTSDWTEWNFNEAYPNFSNAVVKLKRLLDEKPKEFAQFDDLFDFPYNNAGWSIQAKLDYLEFENVNGVFFLTQYHNGVAPNPVNNEELTATFQGLTRDGKFYVGARFSIRHNTLPAGIDFTDHRLQDEAMKALRSGEEGAIVARYLEDEEAKVESLSDETFEPSIPSIKKVIASISH